MNHSPTIAETLLMSISGQRAPRRRRRGVLTAWRRLLRACEAPLYTQAEAKHPACMTSPIVVKKFSSFRMRAWDDAAELQPPPEMDVCDNCIGGGDIRATARHTLAMHPDFDLRHLSGDMPQTASLRD